MMQGDAGSTGVESRESAYGLLRSYTKALTVALGYRDLHTRVHSERVVALSRAIGLRIGLDDHQLEILTIAAAFHDVGKIGVPDDILLKPGRLDAGEMEVMQRHSEAGSDIILATEIEGADEVARVIRHHHEYYDGRGYPDGLAEDEIPLASRIIGIADSYDAMAMTRAYHPPKKHRRIMEILDEETGAKHDPNLMEVFRDIIETSPFKASSV